MATIKKSEIVTIAEARTNAAKARKAKAATKKAARVSDSVKKAKR